MSTAGRTAAGGGARGRRRVPLQIAEIILFEPEPNQVVVRIVASGVCHSDLSVVRGTFPFMFPTVLGHEGSGVVESVGDAVTPGRARRPRRPHLDAAVQGVLLLPRRPVGRCARSGSQKRSGAATPRSTVCHSCAASGWRGSRPTHSCPKGRSSRSRWRPIWSLPRSIGCALSTGVGAVFRTARVAPGSSVAVVGCGGVGLSVMQGAKIAGASKIIAVDRLAAEARSRKVARRNRCRRRVLGRVRSRESGG